MPSTFYVGKRLSYSGYLCTVRYIGEVENARGGEWLGVEWDDPTRGKHNGEYNGVKYFKCLSRHATPASFVRPNRPSDETRTFVQAIRKKYASDDADDCRNVPSATGVAGDSIVIDGKIVEEIGFDKIRKQLAKLQELRIIILDGFCITRPEARTVTRDASGLSLGVASSGIWETCPNIVELDLSRNLFEDWAEIVDICEQLPNLQSLKVDGNRFSSQSPSIDMDVRKSWQRLHTLSLDNTLLPWTEVAGIACSLPALSSLSVGGNEVCKIIMCPLPQYLTTITLNNNNLCTLKDLEPLTALKNLRSLGLRYNQISGAKDSPARSLSVPVTGRTDSIPNFPVSVADVDLSHNAVHEWAFIDALSKVFPGMAALNISHNPLYEITALSTTGKQAVLENGRMQTIARLGCLKVLNFTQVTPKERDDAEMWYLSQIGSEVSFATVDSRASVLTKHPRYAELGGLHGEPTINRLRSPTTAIPNSLAARLIRITFQLGSGPIKELRSDSSNQFIVELPKSFTIYNVLGIVGKSFGLPAMQLELVWERTHGGSVELEVLTPRTRTLATWIEGGTATIMVEWSEVDRKRAAAAYRRTTSWKQDLGHVS